MMQDIQVLSPIAVLGIGVVVLMMEVAFRRSLSMTFTITVSTLVLALLCIPWAAEAPNSQVTVLLRGDGYALLFTGIFLVGGLLTCILSPRYIASRGDEPDEYFLLLLLATMGAIVLAYATHVASLLLGLELMGVALYALIAYPDRSLLPLEAAIKYLVLSGAASAALLFGFALAYGATGALAFSDMAAALAAPESTIMLVAAAAFIFAGLGFKLSLVPFHMWTPDVYQGSPMPVTGFLAAVSKAAVFAVLLRLFVDAQLYQYDAIMRILGFVAILSMLGGNLLALLQSNLKRMLAYSSIAHMGYLLIVLIASRNAGTRALAEEAAIYYLVAYTATTIAAFSLLTFVGLKRSDQGSMDLGTLSGLFWQRPLLAGLMLVAMLSLAGIPLTAGFIGKLYLVQAGVAGSHWIMLGALVIGSSIGIYYYLRVVFYMARRPEDARVTLLEGDEALPGTLLTCALIALVLWLGIAPQPLIDYVRAIL